MNRLCKKELTLLSQSAFIIIKDCQHNFFFACHQLARCTREWVWKKCGKLGISSSFSDSLHSGKTETGWFESDGVFPRLRGDCRKKISPPVIVFYDYSVVKLSLPLLPNPPLFLFLSLLLYDDPCNDLAAITTLSCGAQTETRESISSPEPISWHDSIIEIIWLYFFNQNAMKVFRTIYFRARTKQRSGKINSWCVPCGGKNFPTHPSAALITFRREIASEWGR